MGHYLICTSWYIFLTASLVLLLLISFLAYRFNTADSSTFLTHSSPSSHANSSPLLDTASSAGEQRLSLFTSPEDQGLSFFILLLFNKTSWGFRLSLQGDVQSVHFVGGIKQAFSYYSDKSGIIAGNLLKAKMCHVKKKQPWVTRQSTLGFEND